MSAYTNASREKVMSLIEIDSHQLLYVTLYSKIEVTCYLKVFGYKIRTFILKGFFKIFWVYSIRCLLI